MLAEYGNFLILGLGSGAVFAALALALVVTYRSSGVLNFAIGAQALYAAYTYALLRQGELLQPVPGFHATISVGGPMGFWPGLILTLVIQAVLGVVLYLAIFRPLRNQRSVAKAVASLGVASLLTALVNLQVGTQQILVTPIYPQKTYTIGSIRIPGDRLWFAVTIVAVALVLTAFYRFTTFGLATKASAETEVGALVSGLSPDRIAVINWAISAAVAGLAGILIAPLVPLVPGTYTFFIVPALAAAVVGQFSSITPAVAAGLALGAIESVVVYLNVKYSWIPAGTSEVIPLVLVLAVLVVRGKPLPTRGTLTHATLGRAPRPHSLVAPLVIGIPVAVAGLFLLQHSLRAALITSFIVAIISLSLVVVTGYVGQISLAQLTLAGVAGFALSTIAHDWGVPFPIAPILAALVATVVGVVVGLPALRIRGLLIGVVTLTFAAAVEAFWFRNNNWNGGAGGAPIPTPRLFGIDLGIGSGNDYPRPQFGLLCLAVLVIVAVCVARLRTSHLGSAMLAVRANERSAAAAGINVARVKLLGFAIGAFIAGIGGTLIAYKQSNVTFDSFAALVGLALFTTAYLAGITSVSGGITAGLIGAGGLFFAWVGDLFDIGSWYGILAGAGVILTVIFNPEGLVGPLHAQLEKRRRRGVPGHGTATAPAVLDLAAIDDESPAPKEAVQPMVGSSGPPLPVGHVVRTGSANGSAGVGSDLTETGPLLEVDGLTVHYGGVLAVDEVSFTVPKGHIVGLIGPNGAGKTTTMDALCGFTGCRGQVRLAGESLDGLAPHRRAALGLGRTFQGIDLYEDLTVEENVVVGQHLAGARGSDTVARLLASVGLEDDVDRPVAELSQGQRQLVSIVRALAGEPELLMLDEPAAGLDSSESQWLADRLRDVRSSGVTILLIDHDMSLVLGLCDEIHVLDFGVRIASGDPAAIRDNPQVRAAYLGTAPPTQEAGGTRTRPAKESLT